MCSFSLFKLSGSKYAVLFPRIYDFTPNTRFLFVKPVPHSQNFILLCESVLESFAKSQGRSKKKMKRWCVWYLLFALPSPTLPKIPEICSRIKGNMPHPGAYRLSYSNITFVISKGNRNFTNEWISKIRSTQKLYYFKFVFSIL